MPEVFGAPGQFMPWSPRAPPLYKVAVRLVLRLRLGFNDA